MRNQEGKIELQKKVNRKICVTDITFFDCTPSFLCLVDFQFNLQKTGTARRPDLILETKYEKQIWICDMGCPIEQNTDTKRRDKLPRYQQLAFEIRERRPGYTVTIVPVITKPSVVA